MRAAHVPVPKPVASSLVKDSTSFSLPALESVEDDAETLVTPVSFFLSFCHAHSLTLSFQFPQKDKTAFPSLPFPSLLFMLSRGPKLCLTLRGAEGLRVLEALSSTHLGAETALSNRCWMVHFSGSEPDVLGSKRGPRRRSPLCRYPPAATGSWGPPRGRRHPLPRDASGRFP